MYIQFAIHYENRAAEDGLGLSFRLESTLDRFNIYHDTLHIVLLFLSVNL